MSDAQRCPICLETSVRSVDFGRWMRCYDGQQIGHELDIESLFTMDVEDRVMHLDKLALLS